MRELESLLGGGFKVKDYEHITIEVQRGNSTVPFAAVLPPEIGGVAIRVVELDAILNATGIEFVEYRSKYRQIAERLQSLCIGNVVYNH
ncbi:hypothetical protein J4448_00595 [Candidatus Woesearchaeota archaeon]|nr:hypothetical protein [Candidatus Woesearchaeota archaeon]